MYEFIKGQGWALMPEGKILKDNEGRPWRVVITEEEPDNGDYWDASRNIEGYTLEYTLLTGWNNYSKGHYKLRDGEKFLIFTPMF